MLAAGLPLRADVLKVGHHGSNGSTSRAFIAAVSPRLAVIQVGADNTFGHPHPDVLERLAGVEVLRTDLNGRIEVISDGETVNVKTERVARQVDKEIRRSRNRTDPCFRLPPARIPCAC